MGRAGGTHCGALRSGRRLGGSLRGDSLAGREEARSGVLRVERSLSELERQWAGIRNRAVITGCGLLLLAVGAAFWVWRVDPSAA